MTGTALFFVILGAYCVVANLMKLVLWLDTPRPGARRARRRPSPARRSVDFSVAELELECARFAA